MRCISGGFSAFFVFSLFASGIVAHAQSHWEEVGTGLGRWRSVPFPIEHPELVITALDGRHPVLVAWGAIDQNGQPLSFTLRNNDISLSLNSVLQGAVGDVAAKLAARPIVMDVAERSGQLPDGRILFVADDGKLQGNSERREITPGLHVASLGAQETDSVVWEYKATRWGKYDLYLTYARATSGDTHVVIDCGSTRLQKQLGPTGTSDTFATTKLGSIAWTTDGPKTMTVRVHDGDNDARIDLRALVLVPACEGTPPEQADDGTLVLHARDATVHGTNLRWEPNPIKQTLGYWSNLTDYASWEFTIKQADKFQIEILQGCGKDAGGSLVSFAWERVDDVLPSQILQHTVVDTGHWQNFKPISLGEVHLSQPGRYRLTVRPVSKPGVAVMDLRQVQLSR